MNKSTKSEDRESMGREQVRGAELQKLEENSKEYGKKVRSEISGPDIVETQVNHPSHSGGKNQGR